MKRNGIQALLLFSLWLAACQTNLPATATPASPTATAVPPTAVPATPTATLVPTRSLVICLGQEPATLYAYGGSGRNMWSVLEAIYDGPVDTRHYQPQPVILAELPSLENGGAVIEPVEVLEGQAMVDADGISTYLKPGMKVRPSGCTGADCLITWDGKAPLQMDRLRLTFTLLAGLKWSDGAPLTAADSVFSYQVAADPATPTSRYYIERTASYTALDERSVEWVGVPGFFPPRVDAVFFLPLPQHRWGLLSAADLLTAEISARAPLGWGAYVIEEWTAGDHITLRRNDNYFRAAEGLPRFDYLVFRFLGEPVDDELTALLVGECDVIDQTSLLDEQLQAVLDLQTQGRLTAYIGQGPEWEQLDFGIRPASYDDGYTIGVDRPDFFSDLRVRQAVAACLDRQALAELLFKGLTGVPATYLPPGHPLLAEGLAAVPYDPAEGRRLLEAYGWVDEDGDPATPRTSAGVPGTKMGTPFAVSYYTSQAPLRQQVAEFVKQSLAACGIQVNIQSLPPQQLFAPGPEGVLFGRQFDLAQFSWEAGAAPPCFLYMTEQIPAAGNQWVGVNISGFSEAAYDAACQTARRIRPDQGMALAAAHAAAQREFAARLPALPLFYRLKVAVSRPDLCGLEMDVSARSDVWNLEALDYGAACQP